MLEIRTICENCKKELPDDSSEAMIDFQILIFPQSIFFESADEVGNPFR